MSVHPPTVAPLSTLLTQRWVEAQQTLGPHLFGVKLTWDIGPYDHFKKPRGCGVTFHCGPKHCHLRFAKKMLDWPTHRIDGVIRHELGHVVDMTVPAQVLNTWALTRATSLPSTPERRADAIAEAIWRSAIRYDSPLYVQNTLIGVFPRPTFLGL